MPQIQHSNSLESSTVERLAIVNARTGLLPKLVLMIFAAFGCGKADETMSKDADVSSLGGEGGNANNQAPGGSAVGGQGGGTGGQGAAVAAPVDGSVFDAAVIDARIPDDSGRNPDAGAPPQDAKAESSTVLGLPCSGRIIRNLSVAVDEGGEWAAVRLTPPAYPFRVERVRYELSDGGGCAASLAHRVSVFVTNEALPPSEPTNVQVIEVPTGIANAARTIDMALPRAVILDSGQYLYVAVQLVVQGNNPRTYLSTCVTSCERKAPGQTFWSNASAPPFDWRPFSDFGNFQFFAIGRAL